MANGGDGDRKRSESGGALGLRQAISMAIGGMVGGGIFSVLGVVVSLAGHLAVVSFVFGGAIALATAHAYARLTLASGEAGGSFTLLRRTDHPAAGGWLAWFLILGYVFTMSVYAFTFGHYLANVLGIHELIARGFGLAILAVFVLVNLRGVTTSGGIEDLIVLGKMLILGLVAVIGVTQFSPDRLTPLVDRGILGVFIGASVIFMAYEGFQLLAYDYDELAEPRRDLPRALYVAVPTVIVTYLIVTLGSQALVPDRTLVEQKEVALAAVGDAALGTVGLVLVSVAAVFSTGSAINATLFATARLTRDVGTEGELPHALARERDGVPWTAVVALGVLAGAFSLMPGIEQIVAFGSLTFLVVFATVNVLHARKTAHGALERAIAWTAAAGAGASIVGLLAYLATDQVLALLVIAVVAAVVVAARTGFVRRRRRARDDER